MNAKELIKKLEQAGFTFDRANGSHRIYKKEGPKPITVPYHGNKDLKIGTANKILKDAGLK